MPATPSVRSPSALSSCLLPANAITATTKESTMWRVLTKPTSPGTNSGISGCTLAMLYLPPNRIPLRLPPFLPLRLPLRFPLCRQPPRDPLPTQALNVYPVHAQEMHSAQCAAARSAVVVLRPRVTGFTRPGHRPSPQPPARFSTLVSQTPPPAFPAPRRRQHELPHQRLARQQEAAARLAALTPLPPSPTLSQEERDEALAVRLALGTSPPPSITAPHTRRVSVVSWVHCGEACTAVVQDVDGWVLTWPTIHLTDLSPFLLSPRPLPPGCAYAFNVITDELILLCRVDMVADDEDDVVASFMCFVNHNLYPVQLPAALSHKRQCVTTPMSRRLDKRHKHEPADSSSDEVEVSEVTQMVKLEPVTLPTFRRRPAPAGPPFTATIASTSRRLLSPSPSPPPVASSSRLSTSSSFEARRASSSSPFPSTPSLYFGYSSASSLSLASAGSSSCNPIYFCDEKDENDCDL
ncbi:hypothetical protein B0H14DRAFT_2575997 [Mycena olivaceomarginata]|nr:hypothetical protein B0H14DRAFT_2575997 [Mycena olivaceomarginata]